MVVEVVIGVTTHREERELVSRVSYGAIVCLISLDSVECSVLVVQSSSLLMTRLPCTLFHETLEALNDLYYFFRIDFGLLNLARADPS